VFVGAVVAVAENHCGFSVVELGEQHFADHEPKIGVVAEFPLDVGGGEGLWIGHVEREKPFAAVAEAGDQDLLVGRERGIGDGDRPVDEIAVGVGRIRKRGEVGADEEIGHVGEDLLPVGGVEGVQHAIVGADEDGLRTFGSVFVVVDVYGAGVDDVAEQALAVTERSAVLHFFAPLAAQVVDDVLLDGVGLGTEGVFFAPG